MHLVFVKAANMIIKCYDDRNYDDVDYDDIDDHDSESNEEY